MECDVTALIQSQVDAYNRHDTAAFVATYAPDAEVVTHEGRDEQKMVGRQVLTDVYGKLFVNVPSLKVEIAHRAVLDHHVVDEEVVSFQGATLRGVVAYRVENCLIARADIYT